MKKEAIGLCMMPHVPNVDSHAKYLSNLKKEDLSTAGTATNQREDSRIL